MKLWIIASWWPTPDLPHNGRVFQDLANDLAGLSYDLTVIAPELRSPRHWRCAFQLAASNGSFPVLSQPGLRPPGRLGLWAQRNRLLAMLNKALSSQGEPDKILVLSDVHALGLETWLAQRRLKCPVILQEHHSGISKASLPAAWLKGYESLLTCIDQRLAVSLGQAQSLKRIYGGDWQVVPNPIHDAFFAQRSEGPPAADLLYVGNFKRSKGLLNALQALKLQPDRQLTCLGQGTKSDIFSLNQTIKDLGLESQVRLVAPQPPRQLAQTMAQHRLLIQPSPFETFSLVVHEALAAGLPVASTACCGPEQLLHQAGYKTCPPDQPQSLAQLIAGHKLSPPNAGLMQPYRRQAIARTWARILGQP